MWPSFSLWAWRILKIRSCLRSPLAPGRSKDRAILVSSVIFFSFNSAMVINSPAKGFSKGGYSEKTWSIAGQAAGLVLSSPPLCLGEVFWFRQNRLPFRACNLVQNLIHGFLDSGVGLVKLTGSLGRKLAKHITIPQCM